MPDILSRIISHKDRLKKNPIAVYNYLVFLLNPTPKGILTYTFE